jgi:hypothetical protein
MFVPVEVNFEWTSALPPENAAFLRFFGAKVQWIQLGQVRRA